MSLPSFIRLGRLAFFTGRPHPNRGHAAIGGGGTTRSGWRWAARWVVWRVYWIDRWRAPAADAVPA